MKPFQQTRAPMMNNYVQPQPQRPMFMTPSHLPNPLQPKKLANNTQPRQPGKINLSDFDPFA